MKPDLKAQALKTIATIKGQWHLTRNEKARRIKVIRRTVRWGLPVVGRKN